MGNWLLLMIAGILSIVAGFVALANPFGASLLATTIAGWSFVILGILQVFAAFGVEGFGGKIWALLLGVVAVVLGVNILGEPLQGMLALTIVVGIMFVMSGVFKVIFGFGLEGSMKWALVLSGVVSLVLGAMVLSNIPGSAVVALGVLLAVELLSNGMSMIAMSLAVKDADA
ncbi:DUF308 domain-containing protein [Shimia thalassica]|uniref:HdeD family acid-resistance protein n=1 Tax=Shimia thalassica TaxID=1715693 RepID=UPI0027375844|nr:DUF308 domain-containing protein [Shimia thalassica]MDP2493180.1 DUF308 domain-containing protein [Shimia thalassica]